MPPEGAGPFPGPVLATAVRLIDLGFFRPGGEEYAAENGSFGLATIRREHVTCRKSEIIFEYEEGVTIAPVLAELRNGQDFGDVATKGHAGRAVLRLLTSRAGRSARPRKPRA